MKSVLLAGLTAISVIAAGSQASAQSLSQQLNAVSAEVLAAEARQYGSAVRGAILFPSQKLGCRKCHGQEEKGMLGPDLTKVREHATDVYLVEAILKPSKAIRKGFESVIVVTEAGTSIIGRIIREDDKQIVLRDTSPEQRLITLARSEIDEIVQSKTSSMPEKLVDQLKDRRQFLDLIRYLMEIASTDSARPQTTHLQGGKTISEEMQGLVLLKEFNCAACHQDDSSLKSVSAKQAPRLKWSGGRIDPRHIAEFLTNPLLVKPGTTMPDVMTELSADDRKAAVRELTHYLVSKSDRTFSRQPLDEKAAVKGRELFHSVGCVACHSPRNDAGKELLQDSSVPLGAIESKYNVDGLVEFLKNPHEVRPSGRMPNMTLSHWDATNISHYLLSRPPEGDIVHSPFKLDLESAAFGKLRFEKLGCVRCHSKQKTQGVLSSIALSKTRPDHGCLSGDTGPWPKFGFKESQRKAIQSAMARDSDELAEQQEISLTMTAFRCLNCHQRGELGGVSFDRDAHFHTTNPNLGPQGRIPPTLTGVGAKLNPKWMRQVLVSGRSIRPYVKTRMPQYGVDNIAHLVDLFDLSDRADQLPEIEFGEFADDRDSQKEAKTAGAKMAGTAGLNCIVCHTFQLKQAANMPAVDLTEMAERLQKKWFYHYMRNPQGLSANTVMPSFWPGGRAMRKDILKGDTNQQVEALWVYLLEGRQARTPQGLIRQSLELLATDEAVMLRRAWSRTSKRGIGVGYPGQVNLVFDAEQMRVTMMWKGKFADPGSVWRGQGSGTVRPLGNSLIQFSPGPELDDAETPWVVDDGRPPHHQFKGYTLDDKQRPKFNYEFKEITVEDYLIDVLDASSGKAFIRRTLTLQSGRPQENVVFRAAAGKRIESVGNGTFVIDSSLRIRVDEQHTGMIVDGPSGQRLLVPVNVINGTSTLVLEYVW